MYSPAPPRAWVRYAVYATLVMGILLGAGFRFVRPAPAMSPLQPWRPHPSTGRVIIPDVARGDDARVDDQVIPDARERPGPEARGCWRLRGAGGDGGAPERDRVECRFPADYEHLFEVRRAGRESDLWRISIPRENREAVLVP